MPGQYGIGPKSRILAGCVDIISQTCASAMHTIDGRWRVMNGHDHGLLASITRRLQSGQLGLEESQLIIVDWVVTTLRGNDARPLQHIAIQTNDGNERSVE